MTCIATLVHRTHPAFALMILLSILAGPGVAASHQASGAALYLSQSNASAPEFLALPGTIRDPAWTDSGQLDTQQSPQSIQEHNKALARSFYEDLWFSDNTDRYDRYVADEYVVHDIGDRKGVTEPAVEQKNIADFFHSQGEMTGSIDFQIADGDLVATRWHWRMEPTSLMFRVMGGRQEIPIINVFRFEDGKIVEVWNHRHDIDTGFANFKFLRGFGAGVVFTLIVWGVLFMLRRRQQG